MKGVIDRATLDFLLDDWLRLDQLLARPAFAEHSRESVSAVLDAAERLAESHYLPYFKKADRDEPFQDDEGAHVIPEVRRAIAAYGEAGFAGAAFPTKLGGLGAPTLVHIAATACFSSANGPFAAYSLLSIGNAGIIGQFGTPAQIDTFMRPQLEGRWTGTMALSEPQAGSSLGDITTRAQSDGTDALGPRYRLFGNKMWISAGDHDAADNIVHLVLAKISDPDGRTLPGTKGISIFIVPKFLPGGERNDVVLGGLNHKMGNRGTTNCLLNLGEGVQIRPGGAAGAIGWRIGEPGAGLPIMFRMMNEARIGVGLSAAMMGYRGFRLALDYARNRQQGRPAGNPDLTAKPVPIIEHADVRRMVLACKTYSEGALALILYCAKLVDDTHTGATAEERDASESLLSLLTPVAKTWPSEYGLAANDLAIQVHGGYGYTRDFDVEQLYRDNRLNAIHEGTTGIQALDLLNRKILRDGGKSLSLFAARMDAAIVAAPAEFAAEAEASRAAMTKLARSIEILRAIPGESERSAHATNFLSAFGHTVLGYIWLCVATAARPEQGRADFAAGKHAACRFHFAYEMPKIDAWLAPILTRNSLLVTMRDEWY
jgi:alkylation response protein AidB-like acyl-CoA dehydrogenase